MCLGEEDEAKDGADEDWMIISSYYMKNVGGPLNLDCIILKKNVKKKKKIQ